ncbi:AcrR family transcriptional regulator [Nocardioides luteus]|uniref:TetR family transcriptional regulator n=1 Tax=Nocardioides luteus TaxID=1844 RepID=A0ABQ5T0B5_9ACTN|nr:TetR/AcrR family transcriptional regulator [Nocardioides luteus]MDR7310340.1 AcrR family transcriptional regulator [Nocardioides luteus]GGR53330.1 TetR family transcriptional regulator [Nocardioides luteus]GLJ69880.1 TetR family transcriptional regulator [Nocardioides luteus]
MTEKRKAHQASAGSKRAILEAVLSRAVEAGYEGTTMADVARVSGLPIGSVYWHFKNKEQLFVELLDYCYEVWQESTAPVRDMRELLHNTISRSAAASADLADPAAAFWSIGLVFAFERRLEDNLARQRYLEIRRKMFESVTSLLRTTYDGVPDDVAAELAHDMAVMGRALTDGFRVAAAAGDDTDFDRYASLTADALESLVASRLKEYAHV